MSIELAGDGTAIPMGAMHQDEQVLTVSEFLNKLFFAYGVSGAGVYSWEILAETDDSLAHMIGKTKAAPIPGKKIMSIRFSYLTDLALPVALGSIRFAHINLTDKIVDAELLHGKETSQLFYWLAREV